MPQDFLQMAQEAFTSSTTYFDASLRAKFESNIRQFQGVHPRNSKYHSDLYKSRSRLFRPKTRTTIRKNEAVAAEAFFATNDVVTITPDDDSDPRQKQAADLMQALLNYRLKKSIPWFLTVIGAYQDAQTVGVVCSYQYWLYDRKKKIDKPVVDLLPVENVRIDPGANWADPINTSPYVIRMIPMYVKDVKAKMTKTDPKTNAPKWKPMSDAQIMTASAAYSDTTRQTRERGRTDSKEASQGISDFAIVWVHQNVIEIDGEDVVYYTLGTIGLLTDPVPIDQVWHHGRRPFVMGCCIIETHKTYPDGVADITKDMQGEINEVANQRIDNVKFAMNKRYFAKRNKQVDIRSLTRNIPGSVTMMEDPEKDVVVHSTPDVTASAYQEQDRMNLDFDDVAGAFSPSSVNSNRKLNETVGGLKLIASTTNQVAAYQLRTFVETWVEPVLDQLVALEQAYETDDVVLKLAGKKANLYEQTGAMAIADGHIDFDELLTTELTLNVNVGTGASNPQDQVNNFMAAMKNLREILAGGDLEKYGLKVEEVIKELFGKLGYKDGGRFFDSETQDPALTAAQATIAQLQQQLTQKTSPELVAKQIEKLDAEIASLKVKSIDVQAAAVKKTMETIFAGMQSAEVLAAIPGLAGIVDELMRTAGYQPPAQGMDPNFPDAGAPLPGVALNSIKNKDTGTEFMPGIAGASGDTTPLTPANPDPASPFVGAEKGMTTVGADS